MRALHGPSQASTMALVRSSTPALPEPGVKARMEVCSLWFLEGPSLPSLSLTLLPSRMNEDKCGNQRRDTG